MFPQRKKIKKKKRKKRISTNSLLKTFRSSKADVSHIAAQHDFAYSPLPDLARGEVHLVHLLHLEA